jgi:hypothetical protein
VIFGGIGGDNEFRDENLVLLEARWVAVFRLQHQPEQAMQNPQPFIVIQNAKPIFTVYAYSAEQARALVAAKVAGETIIVAVTLRPTSPVWVAFDGAAQ